MKRTALIDFRIKILEFDELKIFTVGYDGATLFTAPRYSVPRELLHRKIMRSCVSRAFVCVTRVRKSHSRITEILKVLTEKDTQLSLKRTIFRFLWGFFLMMIEIYFDRHLDLIRTLQINLVF